MHACIYYIYVYSIMDRIFNFVMLHFIFFLNVDSLQNQTLIWCYNIYTKLLFFFLCLQFDKIHKSTLWDLSWWQILFSPPWSELVTVRPTFEHWTWSNDRGMQNYICIMYAIMIGTTRPTHWDGCSIWQVWLLCKCKWSTHHGN
jgi:hypothetical protein